MKTNEQTDNYARIIADHYQVSTLTKLPAGAEGVPHYEHHFLDEQTQRRFVVYSIVDPDRMLAISKTMAPAEIVIDHDQLVVNEESLSPKGAFGLSALVMVQMVDACLLRDGRILSRQDIPLVQRLDDAGKVPDNFSTLLSQLRLAAGMSNAQLARAAKVPKSLIGGLQSGKRRLGEFQARKIGTALKLLGPRLDDFVYAAINTCTEKVLQEVKAYPAELLNHGARLLKQAGIMANSILECAIDGADIQITFDGGQTATLTTDITIH